MALGEPLPKQVLGHPWVLFGEDKMSKSKGNVIYADELAARFGADAVRYYLLASMPFAQDGSITHEAFISLYNTDLANTLGNLVNRSVAMANKYFDGKVSRPAALDPLDGELREVAAKSLADYVRLMDTYRNADAVEAVMTLARRCNKYIDETAPWVLAKEEATRPRLEGVLYHLLESIRTLGVLLSPVIPATARKIFDQLGLPEELTGFDSLTFGTPETFSVGEAAPLFARLDAEKVLSEMLAEAEAKKPKAEPEKDFVPFLPEIGIDDFGKADLRVAKIVACEPVKKAKKLLKLTLEDGSGTPRTVASGIAKWYKPEELIGKKVIVVANLKPAVLCGVESAGMILAADVKDEQGEDAARVLFVEDLPVGAKLR